MKRVTVSMSVSLDGFIVGPDGGFDWAPPDEEEFGAFLDEIRGVDVRLRDEPGDGEIAIGGADLAASAAEHDLVDEYRLRVCPVLVGGGRPFFPRGERQVGLQLLSTRTFSTGAVALRYAVRH
jgi:dihydrofolate reductase